jgi:hypothetical protein
MPVVSGSQVQGGTLSPLPAVKIGGLAATVTFAGLVSPGEFQFNVAVPASLANGDQSFTVSYGGFQTQAGTLITVHQLFELEQLFARSPGDMWRRSSSADSRLWLESPLLNRGSGLGGATRCIKGVGLFAPADI